MKTITKMIATTVAVVMMGLVLVACGSVKSDVLGDWTVSTINGKTCEEYAAPLNVAANMVALNLKLEEDKATLAGIKGSQEFQVAYKTNGVELMKDGNNAGSLVYDKNAQTLTMNDNSTGTIIVYIFKKGTTDLTVTESQAEPEETTDSTESQSQEGNNEGFTGADYGELSEEEQMYGGGYDDGINYGERTEEEMAADNNNSNSNSNSNKKNTNNNSNNNNNDGLTGADYGELSEDEQRYGGGYGDGINYGELSEEEQQLGGGYTGADYGENN